jgi:transcriptional regulator with XRE-family HTH domain
MGTAIRSARLERRFTVEDLADRVGVNKETITRIQKGDGRVAIGTVLETAYLVGLSPRVPFEDPAGDPTERLLSHLPKIARPRRRSIDDDF